MMEYRHVLFHEMCEQPKAIRDTIEKQSGEIESAARVLAGKRIQFLGMGSSFYASVYARYVLADLTHLTAVNHLASEFYHYPSKISATDVCVALSQSGESIETVKSVRLLKRRGNLVVAVTNNSNSTLARLGDRVLLTHAGKEKASSTKTFAATLAILYCLAVTLAVRTGTVTGRKGSMLLEALTDVSQRVELGLESWSNHAGSESVKLVKSRAAMVLARGPNLAAALQGALLLKEVAKMPAEGMSSGEFSHGPIEAVSKRVSVIILGGGRTSRLQSRLADRLNQLRANTLMVGPGAPMGVSTIPYGEIREDLAVFPAVLILELLAYHAALRKRLNPDRFRFIHKVTTRE